MLSFIGPTALCAQAGVTDLISPANMNENGWDLDTKKMNYRLVLTDGGCRNVLDTIDKYKWMVQKWSSTAISTSFWDHGRATLIFGNCNNEGRVTILLDGTEIGRSDLGKERTTVTFNVDERSNLTIKTDDRSVIRLFHLKLDCGKLDNLQNIIS